MCGRYGLYDVSDEDLVKENTGYNFKPNYNASPSQTMPVIKAGSKFQPMVWGIHRVVGPEIEKDIINTRSDKAFGRFWGKTVRTKRCLIPANGFYEWKKVGKAKIPFWISLKERPLYMFAGIYDIDSKGMEHYSIMTTEPNSEMSDIHNRMPVILTKQYEENWIDENLDSDDAIAEMLKPYGDNSLKIKQVSTAVNNPRNNYLELLDSYT